MQEDIEILKAAIMHEDCNVTKNNYADFKFAGANGWDDVLTKLIFNKNVNPKELVDWAWEEGHPMTLRAFLASTPATKIEI